MAVSAVEYFLLVEFLSKLIARIDDLHRRLRQRGPSMLMICHTDCSDGPCYWQERMSLRQPSIFRPADSAEIVCVLWGWTATDIMSQFVKHLS